MKTRVGLITDSIFNLDFNKINGLLLTDAEKVPPHIGLVCNGFYYSATANGTILDRKMTSVLEVITKKKKKVLLALFNFKIDKDVLRRTFTEYGPLINGKTCLHPARMCIEKSTGFSFNVNFVFELLPLMYNEKLISNYCHFLLDDYLDNGYYQLTTYSKNDIMECIDRLKR